MVGHRKRLVEKLEGGWEMHWRGRRRGVDWTQKEEDSLGVGDDVSVSKCGHADNFKLTVFTL